MREKKVQNNNGNHRTHGRSYVEKVCVAHEYSIQPLWVFYTHTHTYIIIYVAMDYFIVNCYISSVHQFRFHLVFWFAPFRTQHIHFYASSNLIVQR